MTFTLTEGNCQLLENTIIQSSVSDSFLLDIETVNYSQNKMWTVKCKPWQTILFSTERTAPLVASDITKQGFLIIQPQLTG